MEEEDPAERHGRFLLQFVGAGSSPGSTLHMLTSGYVYGVHISIWWPQFLSRSLSGGRETAHRLWFYPHLQGDQGFWALTCAHSPFDLLWGIVQVFCLFFSRAVSLISDLKEFLHILDTSPLSDIWILITFSNLWWTLHYTSPLLDEVNLLILIQLKMLWVHILYSKDFFSLDKRCKVSSLFPSRSFRILAYVNEVYDPSWNNFPVEHEEGVDFSLCLQHFLIHFLKNSIAISNT